MQSNARDQPGPSRHERRGPSFPLPLSRDLPNQVRDIFVTKLRVSELGALDAVVTAGHTARQTTLSSTLVAVLHVVDTPSAHHGPPGISRKHALSDHHV